MRSESMYGCCWQMACELLQGLETRDLQLIETRLRPLRQTLAARHGFGGDTFDPTTPLWLEQLDLLEGIAETVEASVEAIRRSSQPHLLQIQTAESLLRHLIGDGRGGQPVNLPLC
jgi:hypothetical protein